MFNGYDKIISFLVLKLTWQILKMAFNNKNKQSKRMWLNTTIPYLQKLTLTIPLKRSVSFLICSRQLSLLILQLLKLLELWYTVHIAHLVMQCEECHWRVYCFSALCTESYHLLQNQRATNSVSVLVRRTTLSLRLVFTSNRSFCISSETFGS